MNFYLEIQRTTGIERRSVTPHTTFGVVDGTCPGCRATPFHVQGHGVEKDGDNFRAGGTSMCCSESVGYIYAENSTLFGAEEDRATLSFARCRVY